MQRKRKTLSETLSRYFLNFFLLIPALAIVSASLAHWLVMIVDGGLYSELNFNAATIVRPDYRNIDISDVQKAGGWVEILEDNKVVYVLGDKQDAKNSYAKNELSTQQADRYGGWYVANYTDISYFFSSAMFMGEDGKQYVCLVKIPVQDTRSGLAGLIRGNNLATRFERTLLLNLFATVFFFCMLLVLCVRFYSKLTARIILRPLEEIGLGIASITAGNLKARMHFEAEREFADIRDALNYMAGRLESAEDEKRVMEQNRKQLLMGISHDLKTPITTVYGYAKALTDGMVEDPERQKRHLQYIRDKAQAMTKLIDDLFKYSSIEGSEYALRRKTEDFAEFLRELIAENYVEIENHGFQLDLDIPEDTVTASFDRAEMHRALTNIIGNSIKYNKPGTMLSVTLQETQDNLLLTIGDNGVGISDELKDKIFNEFVRGDAARPSDGGSGLGLAIARRIIAMHGGSIRLLDGGQGQGAVFVITLLKRG